MTQKNHLLEIWVQYRAAIIAATNRKQFLLVGGAGMVPPEKVSAPRGALMMAQKARLTEGMEMLEQLRDKAMQLCAEHGITVRPYAGGWWLVGQEINRVVGELAGLCASDLNRLPVMPR